MSIFTLRGLFTFIMHSLSQAVDFLNVSSVNNFGHFLKKIACPYLRFLSKYGQFLPQTFNHQNSSCGALHLHYAFHVVRMHAHAHTSFWATSGLLLYLITCHCNPYSCSLHHGQVRYVHVCSGHVSRTEVWWDCCECPVAAHGWAGGCLDSICRDRRSCRMAGNQYLGCSEAVSGHATFTFPLSFHRHCNAENSQQYDVYESY